MKPHVIYIVFGERVDRYETSPPWAVCWRHSREEADDVRNTLQAEARRFRREIASLERRRIKASKRGMRATLRGEDSWDTLERPIHDEWKAKSEQLRARMIDRLFPCTSWLDGVRYFTLAVTDDPALAVGAWPILPSRTRGTTEAANDFLMRAL